MRPAHIAGYAAIALVTLVGMTTIKELGRAKHAAPVETATMWAIKTANAEQRRFEVTEPEPPILWHSAHSAGGTVFLDFALPIRADVTEAELDAWRYATRRQVRAELCAALRPTMSTLPVGWAYTYRYLNERGSHIYDLFTIDAAACQQVR